MTTQPDTPSVRERQLARELREARVGAQLPGSETARILGWSASKVSRIETGRIGISPTDLDRLLDLYQVPDEQARYLRRLAPAARTRLRPPGGHGPPGRRHRHRRRTGGFGSASDAKRSSNPATPTQASP
jgi:transcriptional regulator with XRE-family HTH domain